MEPDPVSFQPDNEACERCRLPIDDLEEELYGENCHAPPPNAMPMSDLGLVTPGRGS